MDRMAILLSLAAFVTASQAEGLYLNGGFEALESVNQAFLDAAAQAGVTVSPQFPQVWQINCGALAARKQPSVLRLVADPNRVRSGRGALELSPGEVFLPAVPVQGGAKVTLRFWATGQAAARFGMRLAEGEPQNLYPPVQPVGEPDGRGYVEYVQAFQVPCR